MVSQLNSASWYRWSRVSSANLIVVLSGGNPTMAYGVATVEAVARAVHQDLSAARSTAAPRLQVTVSPKPSPYAIVPALPPYLQ
jgi:hypothetical protein